MYDTFTVLCGLKENWGCTRRRSVWI